MKKEEQLKRQIKKLKEELVISKSQYEYERERAIMTLKKIEK